MNKDEIAIIILAAGSSSRMGQPKQQLVIDGQPLLQNVVSTSLASKTDKIVVVLGSQASANEELLKELPVTVIRHQQWHEGVGSSLKKGLSETLKLYPDLSAVILLVCDQPYLTSAHLNNLMDEFQHTGKAIVASTYKETMGVPALFDQSLFPKLLALKNHQGAKKIIEALPALRTTVPFPKGETDLDTPDDYLNFIREQ